MTTRRHGRSIGLGALIALGAATGCGTAVGPSYEGEPLATFKGQLTSDGAVDLEGGVRLALVWFSHMGESGLGQPKGIITEDVVYRGSFPINYAFDATRPPPAAALADLSEGGGPKLGAVGLLLAYEDLNANRKLDTIPAAGRAIDRILGSSMEFFRGDGLAVVYVDQPAGPDGDPYARDLSPGFNLVKGTPGATIEIPPTMEVVPLSTSIPIALVSDPWLNVYVCDELWTGQAIDDVMCGFPVIQPPPPDTLLVAGILALGDQDAYGNITVMKDEVEIFDATVTLDGTPLTTDGVNGYGFSDPTRTVIAAGATHVIRVVVPPEAPRSYEVTMPGEFAITSPANAAVLPIGAPFTGTWSASVGADEYDVYLVGSFGGAFYHAPQLVETAWTSPEPIADPQEAQFSVTARRGKASPIVGLVTHQIGVTFQ